ncbi:MAG TPA: flagellar assembly peptidoglycan hydrolase FlgJ [Burkholderiaceae bacterium]
MDSNPFNAVSGAGSLNLGGGLEDLRLKAQRDPKSAVREAARQFETLFTQQLLKSMRESAQSDDMMSNEGTKMGNDMLDSQWASTLSGQPGGLSDLIARQLERQMGMTQGVTSRPVSANPMPVDPLHADAPVTLPQKAAAAFISAHRDAAAAAEKSSGIPATFMIAQAAHETGWGRKEIRNADGTTSYNLFGIKAGPNWKGATTDVMTTEYYGGRPHKVVQTFRAYSSYAESFADYAAMIKNSPRYAAVVAAGSDAAGFARGLQRAGYATDPAYATKLAKVIHTTERVQQQLSVA